MRYIAGIVGMLGIALALVFSAGSANAQATRTWVSGVGDDANPCSRTAPCKTLAGAISKTAAKGEINILDPAGVGGVTITKSIVIRAAGIEAGVLVSGTNGIIINVASTDRVVLDGLDIAGTGTGLDGIRMVGGGQVYVQNCLIWGFTGNGINVVGTAGANVTVSDTQIVFNGGGINVQGASNAANSAGLQRTNIVSNTSFGVKVTGGPNSASLIGSTVAGTSALSPLSGGQIVSFGNNVITGATDPTSTVPLR